MNKLKLVFIIIIAFTVSSNGTANAFQVQQIFLPEADTLFQEAITRYLDGQLEKSQQSTDKVLELPRNQRSSAAQYLQCRLALERNDYAVAAELIEHFPVEFPNSRYVPFVHLLQAELYYEKGLNFFALQKLLWVIVHAEEQSLQFQAIEKFINLFDTEIPEKMFEDFTQLYDDAIVNTLITIKVAQRNIYNGNLERAQELLEGITVPSSYLPVRQAVTHLQDLVQEEIAGEKYIAVLFPFNGEFSERGRRIYNGARVALQNDDGEISQTVQLKPVDTEGNITKLPSLIREIAADRSIIGTVGPVAPDLQQLAGTLASIYELPIVIPDNNEADGEDANGYLFQMKGSKKSEGITLARFAVNELNLSTFAILSPIGVLEENMVQSFALEVEKLGGNILTQEWYFPGTIDYNQQLSHIRKIGYDMMMADSLNIYVSESVVDSATIVADSLTVDDIDSLTAAFLDSLSIAALDSLWFVYLDTLTARRREAGIRNLDTLDYPVTTFDAFFIPIASSEDIDFIANQFAYFNLNTVLLGNSTWHDVAALDRVETNFGRLYFTSDYLTDDFYMPWVNFRDNFRQVVGSSPGIDELYGYDSMLFILNAIQGYPLRNRIKNALLQMRSMPESARGWFEMDDSNQKSNWLVLQYRRGLLSIANKR